MIKYGGKWGGHEEVKEEYDRYKCASGREKRKGVVTSMNNFEAATSRRTVEKKEITLSMSVEEIKIRIHQGSPRGREGKRIATADGRR